MKHIYITCPVINTHDFRRQMIQEMQDLLLFSDEALI